MTSRVSKLREQSLTEKPFITEERARLVTETYKRYAAEVSAPMLRALVFKNIMQNKSVSIAEGELIVGERGTLPLATPTFPELCCHSAKDLEIIDGRAKISFTVGRAVKDYYINEIIPYWHGKTMRDRIFASMTPEWRDCYEAGVFTEFMEQRSPGHTVADDSIYRKGFLDFKEEIEESLRQIDYYNDPEAYEKREELEAMLVCADAIIKLAARYASEARTLAEREKDAVRRAELEKIAQVASRVPAHAPQTFWEALQAYWFVHIGVIAELNTWDSFNPGRLDQHLYPFYKNDLENGVITPEFAKELLECFWIKFNNQPAPPKVGVTLEESGTYTDFANINIGGVKPDGSDGVNEASYLLLDVIDEMKLLQPSSNIQLSKKNPDRFLKRACEIIRKGWGQPSIFNTDAVVEELLRQGKSIEDARCGGISGCVETGAFGKESYILTGYLNLVKILEITLNNGTDPRTNKNIGLETGNVLELATYDDLFTAFTRQLHHFIDIKMKGNNIIEKLFTIYMPSPFLSIIIDDCIARGRDYHSGGARYNTNYIQAVGIASITDSLSAIKHQVYEKKNLQMAGLMAALKNNFQEHPEVRPMLLDKTPKYGNDDDLADEILKSVFNACYDEVNGRKNLRGGFYGLNLLSTTCHVYFGSVTGATPDGRLAGTPLSEGISPVQGVDCEGPTAVIKSAAKIDHLKTGGTLLNLKFTPQLLQNDEGLARLAHLVRAYFKLDGHHAQFNVISRETLIAAQQNPGAYKNLIVRVAGYSDYFNNLGKSLQEEIIARTEHACF